MWKIKTSNLLSVLFLFITFVSVNNFTSIPLGNLWTTTLLQLFTIYIILKKKEWLCPLYSSTYRFINLYLLWITIIIIYGGIKADNPIEYKQLMIGSIGLSMPISAWVAYKPNLLSNILAFWYKYAIGAFCVFFFWTAGYTQFYLSPLLLLFCFFPLFSYKKAWMILIAGLLYCILAGDGRSQLLKAIPALLIGFLILLKKSRISFKLIKLGHIIAYLCTLLIFVFILKNIYLVFNGNKTTDEITEELYEDDSDTRSLIYIDVIDSAIKHQYYLQGRTPARGNDIEFSGILFNWAYDDDYVFNKDERHVNEVLHLNTFTWTGLIGLILYSLIYFKATYLAVYKSQNIYISLLGCYVAFQWSYGWIENVQQLDILNISLWIMIGMCYSNKFRQMDNTQFKQWMRTLI